MYLLDWEQSAVCISVYDFFKSFEVLYSISEKAEPVREMIVGDGTGHEIATQLVDQFRSLLFTDDRFTMGLSIMFLLYRLKEINPLTAQSNPAYLLDETIVL